MLVLAGVAGMIIFFVVKPMLKASAGGGVSPMITALATSPTHLNVSAKLAANGALERCKGCVYRRG